jgi:PAS domain S-box-containing protein
LQCGAVPAATLIGLEPTVLLTAGGIAWFSVGLAGRAARGGDPADLVILSGSGAFTLQLIAMGFVLPGIQAYGKLPLGIALTDVSAVAVILSGVVLRVVSAAGLGYRHLAAIWDSTGVGLRLCDRHGRVLAANPAFCRLVGSSGRELIGRHLSECYSAQEAPRIAAAFQRQIATGQLPGTLITQVQLKDGRRLWLDLRISIVHSIPGEPILTAAFDVTSGKAAEQALVRRERQTKILSNAVTKIHSVLDPERVMQAVVETGRELTGATAGAYCVRRGDEDCHADQAVSPFLPCLGQQPARTLLGCRCKAGTAGF